MKRFKIAILALLVFPVLASAQNIGQEGDTKLNYTDINGMKQGHWITKFSNGKTKYEAYFVDDKPVGEFKKYNSYGNLYAVLNYSADGSTASAKFYHRSGKISATGKYYPQGVPFPAHTRAERKRHRAEEHEAQIHR